VAIKILFPLWAKSADATARFEREAMAVAQLQSPHVVQIFDYGVEVECPFIVMELLEGEDLHTRLKRVGRLSMEAAAVVVVQTAKALAAAHAAGIVHRDLKPGNVFLVRSREEEMVKVLDFGVAKSGPVGDIEHEATKEGAILGTPRYMSPEQALASRTVDHRTDLWSLGVIAFRAVTGKVPFGGKSAADVIVRLCTERPPRATALAPDLPPEIDAFFERAMRRDPDQRFQSAREMAKAFADISPTSFPSLNVPLPPPEMVRAVAELRPPAPASSEEITHPGVGGAPGEVDVDEVATIAIPGFAVEPDGDDAATRLAFPRPPDLADIADDTPTPAPAAPAVRRSLPPPLPASARVPVVVPDEPRESLPPRLPLQASPAARLAELARRRPVWFGAGIGAVLALGGILALMSGGTGAAQLPPDPGPTTTSTASPTSSLAAPATTSTAEPAPSAEPSTTEPAPSTSTELDAGEAPAPTATQVHGPRPPKPPATSVPTATAKATAKATAAPTSAPTTTTAPTTKFDPFQDRL